MAQDRDRERNRGQGRSDEDMPQSSYYSRARNRASRGVRSGYGYGSTAGYGAESGYGAADYPGGYGGPGEFRGAPGGYAERGWSDPGRGEPGWGTRQREEYRGSAPEPARDYGRDYGRDYWRDYGGREGGGGGGRGYSERDFTGREVGRSEEYVGGMGYVGGTGVASSSRATRRSRWRREPLKAAEIMTRTVKAVTPDSSIREVAQIMRDENTGVVPVVDQNHQLRGLVTDRDIVMRSIPEGLDPMNMRAADLMTEDVEAVTPDESLRAVVDLMGDKQVRRVPVVDENDRLVGIISMADVATRADYDEDLQDALEEISSRRSFWSKLFA